MAHLRDVRGGKGEQKLFHECVAWLKKRHPLTLITNLPEIVKVRLQATNTVSAEPLMNCLLSSAYTHLSTNDWVTSDTGLSLTAQQKHRAIFHGLILHIAMAW